MIVNNKKDDAEAKLIKVAKTNKRAMSDGDHAMMTHYIKAIASSTAKVETGGKLSPLDMFKPTFLKTTLITLTIWITSVVAYYALTLNATDLAGDMFLNFVYSCLSEIPSTFYVLVMIDLVGRKFSIVLAQATLGLCCVAMAFVPKEKSKVTLQARDYKKYTDILGIFIGDSGTLPCWQILFLCWNQHSLVLHC